MAAPIAPATRAPYSQGVEFRLLFADVDSLQHINNVAIIKYLAEARAAFNSEILGEDIVSGLAKGHAFIVARVTVDFLDEAKYPGHIEVRTGCAAVGRTSFQLAQALFQDERCIAVANSVMVHRHAGAASPVPNFLRARLAENMVEASPS